MHGTNRPPVHSCVCLQPASGLCVSVIGVWRCKTARLVMVHERPERVEEHERQRSVISLFCSLHLLAPGTISGPPPSSLPLYPCSSLPRPAPSLISFHLECLPIPALPPFLCPDPSVLIAFPLPPRLATYPTLPFTLTFERFDDLEFVREVRPSRGPQVEVPQGHDAF